LLSSHRLLCLLELPALSSVDFKATRSVWFAKSTRFGLPRVLPLPSAFLTSGVCGVSPCERLFASPRLSSLNFGLEPFPPRLTERRHLSQAPFAQLLHASTLASFGERPADSPRRLLRGLLFIFRGPPISCSHSPVWPQRSSFVRIHLAKSLSHSLCCGGAFHLVRRKSESTRHCLLFKHSKSH
jgi:hypothetical protein